jgi:phosphatidylserine/phosphatidylglycerophosphate/cardiolipin synthase-like enzyme
MYTKLEGTKSLKLINKFSYLAVFMLILACLSTFSKAEPQPAEILGIYFTPPAGGASGLIKHIDASNKTIKVMAYGFTAFPLSDALIRAHRRGVKVELIQDEKSSQNNRDVVNQLISAGIDVRSDGKHAIQHNKVMIIDDDIVITGSYNFTNSAEKRNAENIMIIKSDYAAKRYADNWAIHWAHAEKSIEQASKKSNR